MVCNDSSLSKHIYLLSKLSHYSDVIMGAMASQITGVSLVYSTVCSGANQRKYQNSASLALVGEFTGDQWIPLTKCQWRGKCFHLMMSSWTATELQPMIDAGFENRSLLIKEAPDILFALFTFKIKLRKTCKHYTLVLSNNDWLNRHQG